MALSGNGNLAVGCGNKNTQTVVFNPTAMVGCGNKKTQTVVFDPTANTGAGAVVAKLTEVSGSDELDDPTTGDYYVTGSEFRPAIA